MKKWLINAGLLCLFSSLCLPAMAAIATFQTISDPVTRTWVNYALSGDGSVMAANYGGEIYRWTAAGGFQDLGPGDPYSSSIGISRDGSTIISGRIGRDGFSHPAIWKAGGAVDLGHPHNGCTKIGNSWGSGYGVSGNGEIAVGLAWTCTAAEGFEWTAKTGNLSLGHPAGNHSSRASAISANATTIVGFWEDPTGPRRPVRWVGGKHDLFLGSNTIGEATAVNSDGTQIVGQSPGASGYGVAFFYSDKRGLITLGTLSNLTTDQSIANGISDNGRVVGWSGDPFGAGIEAFTWISSSSSHMKKLASVLNKLGAKIPAGTTLTTAVSISADGSTMAGQYVNGQTFGNWMAHITK
jgi:probable HAF family extracellular repeat protein